MKNILQSSLLFSICVFLGIGSTLGQKTGTLRGNVYDKSNGAPIIYANVVLQGTTFGATTDLDGFFVIPEVPEGTYNIIVKYVGYDSLSMPVTIKPHAIVYKRLLLEEGGVRLQTVQISGKKTTAKRNVQISTLKISNKQIQSLPSTGGEPDIAQYLRVLPGVVSTGAQGGQIYIRGGSPIQNKILLDGMTIFNPFHSIGFFSVFETEIIKSADVKTGGFGVEYGGRMSAVVDIKTREGDKTRYGGLVSASPFQVKGIVEGPIWKYNEENGNSLSFVVAGKSAILDRTSPLLYSYATVDSIGNLPYKYDDLYGKLTLQTNGGSSANVFGFNFTDRVNYKAIADYNWRAKGGGVNFKLVPPSSSLIMRGVFAYSKYEISESIPVPAGERPKPRNSSINSFDADMNFTYFGKNTEVNYGMNFEAFTTYLEFVNPLNITFKQTVNNTVIAGYLKYKVKFYNLVLEAGVRPTYYASLGNFRIEPRFGLKYNILDNLRFKMAGGLYSQQLMSTVNERDIVNLFTGFITSPALQKGKHLIAGFEFDPMENLELNLEGYYKRYDLLMALNRNRLSPVEPEFIQETGDAYGIDLLAKYTLDNWYVWTTFSHGYVLRDNGDQRYPATFDRRNNVNVLVSYKWGKNRAWEAGARWNFGTGFRFTKLFGFTQREIFSDLSQNPLVSNGELVPVFSDKYNRGILPDYHRLDLSLKRTFTFSKYSKLVVNASVTNAYNRKNILFVNPLRADDKLFQLPFLPSVGGKLEF